MIKPSWLLLALPLVFGACGSSTDNRPPEWRYISPVILQPNCATSSCHSRAAAVAGLDFSDPDRGYISLMRLRFQVVDAYANGGDCRPSHGTVVCERGYRPLVTPYDPAQSRLVHLLRTQTTPRMPPDRPLLEADIRLIEDWILLGASRNLPDATRAAPTAPADAGSESSPDTYDDSAAAPLPDADGSQG